jgi:hypothetical protein
VIGESLLTNTVTLEKHDTHFLVNCVFDKDRFVQVISSVTSRSVLFFGLANCDVCTDLETKTRFQMIGIITLPEPVNPDQTFAVLQEDSLVLKLVKSEATAHKTILAKIGATCRFPALL